MLIRLSPKLGALARDRSGNSLIEFAFGLPILITLYFGCVNLGDAIVLQRKVTNATRALADLTTQGSPGIGAAFTTATLTSQVFAGAKLVLSPYKMSNATMTVSDYCKDSTGTITVKWSESYNNSTSTAQAVPTPVAPTISNNILPTPTGTTPNCITRSDVTYSYSPILGNNYFGPFSIADHIYMGARTASDVGFTP